MPCQSTKTKEFVCTNCAGIFAPLFLPCGFGYFNYKYPHVLFSPKVNPEFSQNGI